MGKKVIITEYPNSQKSEWLVRFMNGHIIKLQEDANIKSLSTPHYLNEFNLYPKN
jgi:hypothetical protein